MKQLKCEECGDLRFKVYEKISCLLCHDNWVWSDDMEAYIKPVSKADFEEAESRDVVTNGQCQIGNSHNKGCILIYCAKCNKLMKHIPLMFE